MLCIDTKRQLSAYMDGALDAKTREALENHLSGCRECRGELAALQATARAVSGLGRVRAPAGFLGRLHEKMETDSRARGFLRALFIPIGIKIPLETAGVAVAALLVFSIWSVEPPKGVRVGPAVERQEPRKKDAEELSDRAFSGSGERKRILADEKDTPTPAFKAVGSPAAAKPGMEKAGSQAAAARAGAGVRDKGGTEETPLFEPIEIALSVPGPESPGDSVPESALNVKTAKLEDAARDRSSGGSMGLREGHRDESPPQGELQDIRSKVKHLVKSLGGKVLPMGDMDAEEARSLGVEVPLENYERFCEGLGAWTDVKVDCPPVPRERKNVQVRVRFLHD